MDGELIRDNALAVSGLLARKIGGPSVKPYQPKGLWLAKAYPTSNTRIYRQGKGEELYRRSLYTFWKRTSPPPAMTTFDAPSREACQVRRERTNTPLQALVLLNDPQFVEAARVLAERILLAEKDDSKRIQLIFRSVTARYPQANELQELNDILLTYKQYFSNKPEKAQQLISSGDSPVNTKINKQQVAAWTLLANQLLNLDEVINK